MQKRGMGVALRARNLSKIFGCVHRTVHWGRESLYEREIFQNLFKIKQNRHATRGKIVQTEGNQACLNC